MKNTDKFSPGMSSTQTCYSDSEDLANYQKVREKRRDAIGVRARDDNYAIFRVATRHRKHETKSRLSHTEEVQDKSPAYPSPNNSTSDGGWNLYRHLSSYLSRPPYLSTSERTSAEGTSPKRTHSDKPNLAEINELQQPQSLAKEPNSDSHWGTVTLANTLGLFSSLRNRPASSLSKNLQDEKAIKGCL